MKYAAQSVTIDISYTHTDGYWFDCRRIITNCDTHSLCEEVIEMWANRLEGKPLKVGVVLGDIIPALSAIRSLFDESREREKVSTAMNLINEKLGDHAIYLGGMFGAAEHDPLRISFTRIPEARRIYVNRQKGHSKVMLHGKRNEIN